MKLPKKARTFGNLLAKKLSRKGYKTLLFVSISFSWFVILFSVTFSFVNPYHKVLGIQTSKIQALAKETLEKPIITVAISTPIPTNTPTPTPTITPTPTKKPIPPTPIPTKKLFTQTASSSNVQKIDDVTWRVDNVQNDDRMASPQDIFNALNSYRGSHGAGNLSWDSYLASYAQGRADLFAKNGSLDGHSGFMDFMHNDGFSKAGFNSLGENSAFLSGPMNGDRIIRSIFGADSAHDNNQLDPSWTHVGVGVNGNAINVNFGKGKR